jgi:tetratricopeptide (TPR) repeat protein
MSIPDDGQAFRDRVNQVFNQWQGGALSYEDALQHLESLRTETQSNPANEASIDNTLGIMNGYRSNFDDSIRYFEHARMLYEQAGETMRVASCDLNLGETYRLTGSFTRARAYFHQAYEQGVALNAPRLQTISLTNEGQVWISLENMERATATLEKALTLSAQPWGDPETEMDAVNRADNVCEIHHALVTIRLREKSYEEAWQHALESLESARFTGRPIRVGYAFRAVADVLTELGHSPDPAFPNDPDIFYQEAIQAFQQVKADGEVAKTLLSQGMSLGRRGKKRSAGQLLQQAMANFTRLGMADDAARAGEEQLKLI